MSQGRRTPEKGRSGFAESLAPTRVRRDRQGRVRSVSGDGFSASCTYAGSGGELCARTSYECEFGQIAVSISYDPNTGSCSASFAHDQTWVHLIVPARASEEDVFSLSVASGGAVLSYTADVRRELLLDLIGPKLRGIQRDWRRSGLTGLVVRGIHDIGLVPGLPFAEAGWAFYALANAGLSLRGGRPNITRGILDPVTRISRLQLKMIQLFLPQIIAQQAGGPPAPPAVPPPTPPAGSPPGTIVVPGLPPTPTNLAAWVATKGTPPGCRSTSTTTALTCWRVGSYVSPTLWAPTVPGTVGSSVAVDRVFPSVTYIQVTITTVTVSYICPGSCWDSSRSSVYKFETPTGATSTVGPVTETSIAIVRPGTPALGPIPATAATIVNIPCDDYTPPDGNKFTTTPVPPSPLCT